MFKELAVRLSGEAGEVVRRLIESGVASGPNEAVGMALAEARERGLIVPPPGPPSKAKGLHLRLSAENARAAHALVKAGSAADPEQAVDWALRRMGRTGIRSVKAVERPAPASQAGQLYSRRDFTRCTIIALVVGTALVLINVRPVAGEGPDVARIVLNYLVPFIVATSSAVLANHARVKAAKRPGTN